MQRRALHADKTGRAADVPAKAVDLRQKVFALKKFARVAQGIGGNTALNHDLPVSAFAHARVIGQLFMLDIARGRPHDQHPLHEVF